MFLEKKLIATLLLSSTLLTSFSSVYASNKKLITEIEKKEDNQPLQVQQLQDQNNQLVLFYNQPEQRRQEHVSSQSPVKKLGKNLMTLIMTYIDTDYWPSFIAYLNPNSRSNGVTHRVFVNNGQDGNATITYSNNQPIMADRFFGQVMLLPQNELVDLDLAFRMSDAQTRARILQDPFLLSLIIHHNPQTQMGSLARECLNGDLMARFFNTQAVREGLPALLRAQVGIQGEGRDGNGERNLLAISHANRLLSEYNIPLYLFDPMLIRDIPPQQIASMDVRSFSKLRSIHLRHLTPVQIQHLEREHIQGMTLNQINGLGSIIEHFSALQTSWIPPHLIGQIPSVHIPHILTERLTLEQVERLTASQLQALVDIQLQDIVGRLTPAQTLHLTLEQLDQVIEQLTPAQVSVLIEDLPIPSIQRLTPRQIKLMTERLLSSLTIEILQRMHPSQIQHLAVQHLSEEARHYLRTSMNEHLTYSQRVYLIFLEFRPLSNLMESLAKNAFNRSRK